MSDLFKVGESAMVRTDIRDEVCAYMAKYLGETVVIEGPLRFVFGHSSPMYLVRCLADHSAFLATHRALKKLPPSPPSTDMLDTSDPLRVTRWSECPFQPQGVNA
jgi:hypothetical protein